MKTGNKRFLTTQEVSKYLGLSVGTVQRMVENGVLEAIKTEGGHRRIYTESLETYCKNKGLELNPENEKKCICIVGDKVADLDSDFLIAPRISIHIISDIFQIIRLKDRVDSVFWDARRYEDNHAYREFINVLSLDHEILIYNSQVLSRETIDTFSPNIRMLPYTISAPVIDAYLYGRMH